MSDNSNGAPGASADAATRQRRGSITQAALSQLFNRGNSVSGSGPPVSGSAADAQRRRLSVTTLGLSGGGPGSQAPSFNMRRSSMSTNSDSIDESAIEEDDGSGRNNTTTPFTRRMSFGGTAMRYRPGGSPGNGNGTPASPLPQQPPHARRESVQVTRSASMSTTFGARRPSAAMPPNSFTQASLIKLPSASSDNPMSRPDQQGFNWSEQLRSRAESSVSGARPSVSLASTSPPRAGASQHDRSKSIADMPQPPAQSPKPKPEARKPDAFQERILKGDFYMD